MSALSSSPRPAPPYSVGTVVLIRPSRQASSKTSLGNLASRSAAAATGMMRSFVKRRAASERAVCSSERLKSSIGGLPLLWGSLSILQLYLLQNCVETPARDGARHGAMVDSNAVAAEACCHGQCSSGATHRVEHGALGQRR